MADGSAVPSRRETLERAEGVWRDFATPERGFFIREVQDGVSDRLRSRFEEAKEKYLSGEIEFDEVYRAFTRWAKSTRRYYYVKQLEGELYSGAGRAEQEAIHRAFKRARRDPYQVMQNGLKATYRKVVTPQVDMQADQLNRAAIYFRAAKFDVDRYVDERVAMKESTKEAIKEEANGDRSDS